MATPKKKPKSDKKHLVIHDDRVDLIQGLLRDAHTKLDKHFDKMSDMEKTLAVNTDNLAEHMRRTEALEQIVETTRTEVEEIKSPFYWASRYWKEILAFAGVTLVVFELAEYIKTLF